MQFYPVAASTVFRIHFRYFIFSFLVKLVSLYLAHARLEHGDTDSLTYADFFGRLRVMCNEAFTLSDQHFCCFLLFHIILKFHACVHT